MFVSSIWHHQFERDLRPFPFAHGLQRKSDDLTSLHFEKFSVRAEDFMLLWRFFVVASYCWFLLLMYFFVGVEYSNRRHGWISLVDIAHTLALIQRLVSPYAELGLRIMY